MTLKSGVYTAGGKTFVINRSKMSSSALRKVEYDYNQAVGMARKAAAEQRARELAVIQERKRDLLRQDEARELQREQTLAKRVAEGSRVSNEQKQFLEERGQTVTTPARTQTGGGRSSTFEQAVQASRMPLQQRRAFRDIRREEQDARKALEQQIRVNERATADQYPGFYGKRPSEILKSKKLLDPARAKQATSVADILRIGEGDARLLPPLSQGGGGAVRLLHAVEKVPYGGAMEGILTPEAAQQLGFARIQRRQTAKTLETPVGQRATRQAVSTAKEKQLLAVEIAPPTSSYEVYDTKLGEVKTFKTEIAAQGFAQRQYEADKERILRSQPPKIVVQPQIKDEGFEVTTFTSTSSTTTEDYESLFPTKPLSVDLPIIGRVEEPFISPLLVRGVAEASQKIREQKALGKGINDPETKRKLSELTNIGFEITSDTPISKPVLQRISQLDLPFIDIKPSLGAQTAITGLTLGIAGPTKLLFPIIGGATVGRKVEQETGSPLLGLAAAGLTAGGISKIQNRISTSGLPSLKPVKSKFQSIIKKPKLLDAKVGKGLKITSKPFIKGEKLHLQLQGLGKNQKIRISPAISKAPVSDDLFSVYVKRSGSKIRPYKVFLDKPGKTFKSTLSAPPAPGSRGFNLSEFVKESRPSTISNIKALSKITSRKTGATDFFVRFGKTLGKKGSAQVSIINPPISKIATGVIKVSGRIAYSGALPIALAGTSAITPAFIGGGSAYLGSRDVKVRMGPVTVQRKARVMQIPQVRKPKQIPNQIISPILQPVQKRKIGQIQPQPSTPQTPIPITKLIYSQPQTQPQRRISALSPLPPYVPYTLGSTTPSKSKKPPKTPKLPPGSDFSFGRGGGFSSGFKTLSGLASGKQVLDLAFGKKKKGKNKGYMGFLR